MRQPQYFKQFIRRERVIYISFYYAIYAAPSQNEQCRLFSFLEALVISTASLSRQYFTFSLERCADGLRRASARGFDGMICIRGEPLPATRSEMRAAMAR